MFPPFCVVFVRSDLAVDFIRRHCARQIGCWRLPGTGFFCRRASPGRPLFSAEYSEPLHPEALDRLDRRYSFFVIHRFHLLIVSFVTYYILGRPAGILSLPAGFFPYITLGAYYKTKKTGCTRGLSRRMPAADHFLSPGFPGEIVRLSGCGKGFWYD